MKQRKHKVTALAAAALLLLFNLPLTALAETGTRVDNFDGKPEESREVTVQTQFDLGDGSVYDTTTGYYRFSVGSGYFDMSVPTGMVMNGTVKFKNVSAVTGALYRNGQEVEDWSFDSVSRAGSYSLTATSGNDKLQVYFTLVAKTTGAIREYKLPEGFLVVAVTRDGEKVRGMDTYVTLEEDGHYEVDYRNPEIKVDYCLSVDIDHQAPELVIEGVTDHKSNGTVTISTVEPDTTIRMERGGELIDTQLTLKETGVYNVTAIDPAGNERLYEFVIVANTKGSWKTLALSVAALIAVTGAYMLYSRRTLRIR